MLQSRRRVPVVSHARLARNVWWLLVSRMLAGFMAGNIAAAFAYASDVSAPEQARRDPRHGGRGHRHRLHARAADRRAAGRGRTCARANFVLPGTGVRGAERARHPRGRWLLPESHTAEHRAAHPDARRAQVLAPAARASGACAPRGRDAARDLLASRSSNRFSPSGRCTGSASGRAPWACCCSGSRCRRCSCKAAWCACWCRGSASSASPLPVRSSTWRVWPVLRARRVSPVTARGTAAVRPGTGRLQPECLRARVQAVAGHDRGAVHGSVCGERQSGASTRAVQLRSAVCARRPGGAVPGGRLRHACRRAGWSARGARTRRGAVRRAPPRSFRRRTRTWCVGSGTTAGGPSDAAVADVERGAVQRAHQARRPQPPSHSARVRMGADVIECEHAFAGVADHDLAAVTMNARMHAAGKLGQLHAPTRTGP